MAISGAFKVECGEVFPHGRGVVGAVSPLADFDGSTKDNRVQAGDKESGLPVWTVEVIDFDPEAREQTFKVKIAAAVQPVPPDAVAGAPVRPVMLGRTDRHPLHQRRHPAEDRLLAALHRSRCAAPRSDDAGKAA